MRVLPLVLVAGCIGGKDGAAPLQPGAGAGSRSLATEDPGGAAAHVALLQASGVVLVGEGVYALEVTEEAAELGRVLARSAGGQGLHIIARKGTPMAHVQRLLAVLEAAGLDDYRLDLGQ